MILDLKNEKVHNNSTTSLVYKVGKKIVTNNPNIFNVLLEDEINYKEFAFIFVLKYGTIRKAFNDTYF